MSKDNKLKKYTANNIQVLEGIEHVRLRPGMYIGNNGNEGLHHLVYEVVDNSIDEALAGFCKNITVTIQKDNSVSVVDDGRGIPTDINEKAGVSGVELALTTLNAGGKFNSDTYKVSGGLHGVGVSVVNALSDHLSVEVKQRGQVFRQTFERGHKTSELVPVGTTNRTGTTVTFHPDPKIFSVSHYDFEILENRLRELAYLNKGISITLKDERENPVRKEVFCFEGGLKSYIEYLDRNKDALFTDIIYYVKDSES